MDRSPDRQVKCPENNQYNTNPQKKIVRKRASYYYCFNIICVCVCVYGAPLYCTSERARMISTKTRSPKKKVNIHLIFFWKKEDKLQKKKTACYVSNSHGHSNAIANLTICVVEKHGTCLLISSSHQSVKPTTTTISTTDHYTHTPPPHDIHSVLLKTPVENNSKRTRLVCTTTHSSRALQSAVGNTYRQLR